MLLSSEDYVCNTVISALLDLTVAKSVLLLQHALEIYRIPLCGGCQGMGLDKGELETIQTKEPDLWTGC